MYDPITVLIVWGLFSVGLFLLLCFLPKEVPFSICCKTGLVVLTSLNFCLSGKLLISPSNLKESLAGRSKSKIYTEDKFEAFFASSKGAKRVAEEYGIED